MINKTINYLLLPLLLTLSFKAESAVRCAGLFIDQAAIRQQVSENVKTDRTVITTELLKFAAENNLETKWVEVGPKERRVRRLFVALDYTNKKLLENYMSRFNLESPLNENGGGTLVIETALENNKSPEHYLPVMYRRKASAEAQIYRWGRPDVSWTTYLNTWFLAHTGFASAHGIRGFGHLIELRENEKVNVEHFLDHPEERGACKSDNCVAWNTGIELGRTAKDATDAERRYLFNELGVARSMAHFEIARRLFHAANDNHSSIIVFVEGAKGIETFKTKFADIIPPEPKIPYASIIRGVDFKNVEILQALKQIPDGGKVFIPIAAGASPEGFNALIDYANTLAKGIDVHVLVNGLSATDMRKAVESTNGKLRLHALFLGGNMRELYSENKVSVIPGNLSDFTRMMKDPKNPQFHYDAILVRVSPENAEGRHSLGPNQDMIMTILKSRPEIKIIAEVNENIPYTNGKNNIAKEAIHTKFMSKSELAGPAVVPPSAVDSAIGMNLGELIDSGAKLQVGIGNIFSGLPAGLQHFQKKNITVSTEMFGDPLMDLMTLGIVKKAETGFAYGSKKLYQWLNHNDTITFVDTEYVNSPGRIARSNNFHAVNTALQVNLYGEVNATMGPEGRISSPGGQVEFMSGASRSQGGKAIIAIRSTAKNGTLSSIVLDFYKGPITTPHENVTHIVTEFGIASIRGKNESERVAAIINLAHPKFRKALLEEALTRKMITVADAKSVQLEFIEGDK